MLITGTFLGSLECPPYIYILVHKIKKIVMFIECKYRKLSHEHTINITEISY